jgi:hypothetical protein
MVIRADDLALLDLCQDFRPRSPGVDHLVDLCGFVTLVIELQDHDIGFPTVHTRVLQEVGVDAFASLGTQLPPS